MTSLNQVRRTFERPTCSTEILALSYLDSGEGVPVFLQHGLCGSANQTGEVFPPDVAARLVTLECRGHGDSPAGPLDELSIATFADDLHALIAVTTDTPAVVGGISMGAAIALRLAILHPRRVCGLILARPAWLTESAPSNMAPNLEVGRLLSCMPPRSARNFFLAGATADRLRREAPANLGSLVDFFSRQPREVTAALLRRISVDGPGVSLSDLSRIQVPTLVIGHGEDLIHPIALAQSLAWSIPEAEFVEVTPKSIDRSAHLRDMQSAIGKFLRRHCLE